MVKIYKMFFLICGIIILCVGCGKDKEENHIDNGTSGDISNEEDTPYKNTQNIGDYFKNVNIVQDYDPNKTSFNDDGSVIMTMDNDLMYSIIYNKGNYTAGYIYVTDFKTGVQLPLCSKIDCSHNNDRCNAYIGAEKNEYINLGYICSIKNTIYIFGEKGKRENNNGDYTEYFLMRISSDGSIREDLGTVLTVYGDSAETVKEGSLIHKGFLYYVVGERKLSSDVNDTDGNITNKIYRYSIDGSGEPECVYEFTYSNKQDEEAELSVMLEALGENLYIRQTIIRYINSDEFRTETEYEEYKINIDTLEKEKISTEINYCNQTERDSLLNINRYNTSGSMATIAVNMQLEFEEQCRMQNISFYNYETKETKNMTEKYIEDDETFDWNDFWVTDKYICLNVQKINGGAAGIYIFDFNLNLVKKLDDMDKIDHCFGQYILWHEGSESNKIYYMTNIEECISGNKRNGEVFNTKESNTEMRVNANRYIYEE